MNFDLLSVTTAATIGVGLIVAPYWIRYRTRHATAISDHIRAMGEDGAALIRDPSVPDVVSDMVYRSMTFARDPRLARSVMRSILNGSFFRDAQANLESPSPIIRGVALLNSDQSIRFARFTANLMLSSASSDFVFAVFTRRVVTWGLMSRTANEVYDSPKVPTLAAEAAASMGMVPDEPVLALAS